MNFNNCSKHKDYHHDASGSAVRQKELQSDVIYLYSVTCKALCLTHAAVFVVSQRSITHPLFIQLKQGVSDLGRVRGQAKAVKVQFRQDELQQPLGRQAPRGGVTSSRGHRLLQDGTSQCLHLCRGFTFKSSSQINFYTH